jgi:hypothetical protein
VAASTNPNTLIHDNTKSASSYDEIPEANTVAV